MNKKQSGNTNCEAKGIYYIFQDDLQYNFARLFSH